MLPCIACYIHTSQSLLQLDHVASNSVRLATQYPRVVGLCFVTKQLSHAVRYLDLE